MEFRTVHKHAMIGESPPLENQTTNSDILPQVHIWLQWFNHSDETRAAELEHAVSRTISLSHARYVHFLQEPGISVPSEITDQAHPDTTITITEIADRLTFNAWLEHVTRTHMNSTAAYHVIINTDIEWTSEATNNLVSIPFTTSKCAACVLRHEHDGELYGYSHDAQDAWVVHSNNIPTVPSLIIPLGIIGCDNRFAYELARQGFVLYNPPRLLPVIHHHSSSIRSADRESDRIPTPYLLLKPTFVSSTPDAEWLMNNHVISKIQRALDPRNIETLRIVSLPWKRLKTYFESEQLAVKTAGFRGDLSNPLARTRRRELHRFMRAAAKADIVAIDKEDHHPALVSFSHKCLVSALAVSKVIPLSNCCMFVSDAAEFVDKAHNEGGPDMVIYISNTADGAESVINAQNTTAKVLIHVLSV